MLFKSTAIMLKNYEIPVKANMMVYGQYVYWIQDKIKKNFILI